ncbi:hypothetical protein BD779DRAFT_1671541 [Infundibulicybe gibba]|nr:hypothetical protein BD779DRAFT_1671541 [Infundibulicybe gibba]
MAEDPEALLIPGLAPTSPTTHGPPLTDDLKHPNDSDHDLACRILRPMLPYEPHDYIIEGICSVMNGRDLLATTVTGGGKTGFFLMLMLVASAISKDPALSPNQKNIPKDPAMILICPTKALQEDMSLKMISLGLKMLVMNNDTYLEGIKNGVDLWAEAREKYTMILLSPEQLVNRGFSQLLENTAFSKARCKRSMLVSSSEEPSTKD